MRLLDASILAVAMLLPVSVSAQADSSRAEPVSAEEFLAWAASALIPIDIQRWQATDLSALDQHLEGKRFVFIGEPDHFIEEKYAARLMVIDRCLARGFRHLGMEMGRSDGLRIDRFLHTGTAADLQRVRFYALGKRHGPGPNATFADRELSFLRDLRQLAVASRRVDDRAHWFGFDIDHSVGGGFEDIPQRLQVHANAAPVKEFLAQLEAARVGFRAAVPLFATRQSLPHREVDRLVAQLQQPDDNPLAAIPAGLRSSVLRDLRCLADSLRLLPIRTRRSYVLRERTMFRQFDDYVADLGKTEKVVLMGHDLHLSKDYTTVDKLWPSIGSHVHKRFGDQVYSIWMMYDHGSRLHKGAGKKADSKAAEVAVKSLPGTVESVLARLESPAFLLPLDDTDPRVGWLDRARNFRMNGNWPQRGKLRRQADAILFVRRVTAPRPS